MTRLSLITLWLVVPLAQAQTPYARLDFKTGAQLLNEPQTNQFQGTRQNDPDRVAMRNQRHEIADLLKQGSVDLERARVLCSYLHKELGVPSANALWAQEMLQRLAKVAEDPHTTPEARSLIHDDVRSYYEQQGLMQPANEFVSPYCMKAMGMALAASGDDVETTRLADSLTKGASDWLRRLGRDEEAKEMDEIGPDRPTDDLVTEILRAYGQLLSERVPLARSEVVRIQRNLCALVKRNEVKSRDQWAL